MVVTTLDQKRNACIDALNDLMHSCSEMAQECRDTIDLLEDDKMSTNLKPSVTLDARTRIMGKMLDRVTTLRTTYSKELNRIETLKEDE